MYSLYDGDIWCGMAYMIRFQDLVYIFYFAVDSNLRGSGYGTKAIKAILEKYKGQRVFLALEDWKEEAKNHQQRIKRHNFYQKCGLKNLPYRLKEGSMTYAIMGVNGIVEPDEYKAMVDNYLGWPLRYLIEMKIIKE